jgi:hypothetical protein
MTSPVETALLRCRFERFRQIFANAVGEADAARIFERYVAWSPRRLLASVTRAVYKRYGDSVAVSNLKQFADRGHSLVVDNGWLAVADYVLDWLARHGIHAELPDETRGEDRGHNSSSHDVPFVMKMRQQRRLVPGPAHAAETPAQPRRRPLPPHQSIDGQMPWRLGHC